MADGTEEQGDDNPLNGDETTTSARERAWWLSTLVVGWIVFCYTAVYAYLVYTRSPVLTDLHHTTFIAITLLSVAYVVGPGAVTTLNKLRG